MSAPFPFSIIIARPISHYACTAMVPSSGAKRERAELPDIWQNSSIEKTYNFSSSYLQSRNFTLLNSAREFSWFDYQSVNPGKHGFAPEWRGRRRSGISRKAKCVCAADSRVEWGQSGKPKKCCDKSKFLLPVLRSPKKNKMTPLGLLWRHKTGLPDFIRHLYFFWTFRCFRDLMCCKEGGPKCKQEGKVGRNILFPNNDTNLPFDNPAAG